MNKLKSPVISRKSRRMVQDMPLRQDLLLDHNTFTSIVHYENPSSILSLLGFGFGENVMLGENNDPLFEMKTAGIGSNYIKIKEIQEKSEPLRVMANSKVPDTILANVPFEVTFDRGILDSDENIHCRDMKSFGTTVSVRPGLNGFDYTIRMSGIPGTTYDGAYLFQIGAPVNYYMGNTQGEGSAKSNTLPTDIDQYNTFFNPMPVLRYKLLETGDGISDETYTLTQTALDGTSETEYNTGLQRKWLRKVLKAWENQILYSTANFNPRTYEIGGRNNNSAYPERALFAGVYEQLDQAPFQWTHRLRDTYVNGLKKLDRIMQTLFYMPGNSRVYYAMCQGTGAQWLRNVIRDGALASSPIRINVSPDQNDAIKTGFKVEAYVCDFGELYIYDVQKSLGPVTNNYDTTSYDGMRGGPRSNEIFFFNATTEVGGGRRTKVAKYFTKEGNLPGRTKVNRGFVFASSKGITGEGNGMTGAQGMALQESAMEEMMNNSRYRVDSLVDGNEYHALIQGVPYIDARGICKMTLI